MEWKKPFALFAGSFGFFLTFALYLFGDFLTNPHVAQQCHSLGQGCTDFKNWTCRQKMQSPEYLRDTPFTRLMCTYLDDFKSFGYDLVDAKSAIAITCFFYMTLNGLLIYGLTKPEVTYRYQLANALSSIALMSTLVYVSYLMKLYTTLSKII